MYVFAPALYTREANKFMYMIHWSFQSIAIKNGTTGNGDNGDLLSILFTLESFEI